MALLKEELVADAVHVLPMPRLVTTREQNRSRRISLFPRTFGMRG